MKIKFKDLALFMEYATKEKPEFVSISPETFSVDFSFMDSEQRECTVTLFDSTANTTPDLIKKMKLYTRTKESKKKGEADE